MWRFKNKSCFSIMWFKGHIGARLKITPNFKKRTKMQYFTNNGPETPPNWCKPYYINMFLQIIRIFWYYLYTTIPKSYGARALKSLFWALKIPQNASQGHSLQKKSSSSSIFAGKHFRQIYLSYSSHTHQIEFSIRDNHADLNWWW